MDDTITIVYNARKLGPAAFWRMVRWCHAAGASEFTLNVFGFDVAEVQRIWHPVAQALRPFEQPPAVRDINVFCTVETETTDLWELNESSIAVLETIGLDYHFLSAAQQRGRFADDQYPQATLHYLCLYRDAEQVLGMFEEQGAYVAVTLQRGESEVFRAQQFGPEDEVNDSREESV